MHVRLQCNMPLFSLYMKSCCSDYSTHPCRTWLATEALVTVARDNINARATGTGRRFPLPYLCTLFVLKRGCNNNPRFSGLPLHFIRWICEWSPTTSSPSITKTVICSFAVSLLRLLLLPLPLLLLYYGKNHSKCLNAVTFFSQNNKFIQLDTTSHDSNAETRHNRSPAPRLNHTLLSLQAPAQEWLIQPVRYCYQSSSDHTACSVLVRLLRYSRRDFSSPTKAP